MSVLRNLRALLKELNVYKKYLSILSVMLLLQGCVSSTKFETSDINLCGELPSVSVNDTTETILEVDNFNAKYVALYCNAK
jgi:hypothetical protein